MQSATSLSFSRFSRSRLALTCVTRCHTTVKEGVSAGLAAEAKVLPRWMADELRANHSGEYGAVRIYLGALAGLKLHHAVLPGRGPGTGPSPAALLFLREHEENERVHRRIMEELTRMTM